MRCFLFLLMMVCTLSTSNAQIYEIGIFAGGSNVIGDVGATTYINPNQVTFGALAKWNRSPRHAYRISVLYTELEAVDSDSDDPRRQQRNYSFNNGLLEVSAGLEFTFFDFNQHDISFKSTPYLFTGITAARYDDFFFNSNGIRVSQDSQSWAFGIPITLGYKALITPSLVLAGEIGARYTFSDNLDGSNPEDAALGATFSFGNTNSNDWYVFSGITLTYTFGEKPCYCGF